MCDECSVLQAGIESTGALVDWLQQRVSQLEAENKTLSEDWARLRADRDQKRQERDELRDELTALKRRITSHMVGQDVYWGVK